MRRFILIFATMFGLCTVVSAQETGLVTLETGQASRGWEAVGRLDIAGKGFCTAALIQDQLILTAAHCVYDRDNSLIDASRFTFQAGLRNGRAEAVRAVSRLVAHPDYIPDGLSAQVGEISHDLAVLELDQAIRTTRIRPFPISERPRRGDEVGIVSYGRGREEVPSLQEVCSVIGRQAGAIVMTCDVEEGSSGSPVFSVENGVASIVSVVSAIAYSNGAKISLGTSLAEPLKELLSHFATLGPASPGGAQRLITFDERNDTGAKFLRP